MGGGGNVRGHIMEALPSGVGPRNFVGVQHLVLSPPPRLLRQPCRPKSVTCEVPKLLWQLCLLSYDPPLPKKPAAGESFAHTIIRGCYTEITGKASQAQPASPASVREKLLLSEPLYSQTLVFFLFFFRQATVFFNPAAVNSAVIFGSFSQVESISAFSVHAFRAHFIRL